MPSFGHLQTIDWGGIARVASAAYLFGCLTTGYYLVRYRTGQDIRLSGSGSVGARNVGRLLGWPGFVLTLLGDFAKGAIAVWAAGWLTLNAGLIPVALLAVVVGHIWPFQLGFRGGKGVATSLGALCVYDVSLAGAFAVAFGLGFLAFRRSLFPALLAFTCLPVVAAFQRQEALDQAPEVTRVGGLWLLAGVVLIAHRKNILDEFSRLIETHNPRARNSPPRL